MLSCIKQIALTPYLHDFMAWCHLKLIYKSGCSLTSLKLLMASSHSSRLKKTKQGFKQIHGEA